MVATVVTISLITGSENYFLCSICGVSSVWSKNLEDIHFVVKIFLVIVNCVLEAHPL